MSGVVLRRPHRGTTQAGPGECEACHEAQVAIHGTNHRPGRWLDHRRPQCRARFGEAFPAAKTLPPPATRPNPATPDAATVREPGRRAMGGARPAWPPLGRCRLGRPRRCRPLSARHPSRRTGRR